MSEQPLGLRDRSKIRRMNAIKEAAEQLFAERGFESVSTKEIAAQAEVGEATLFRYVTNKDELLLLILRDRMDQLLAKLQAEDSVAARPEQTAETILNRVRAVYEARAEFYAADPGTVTSYLWHGFRPDSKLGAHSLEQGDGIIELVVTILREGRDLGLVDSRADVGIVAMNCNALYIHEVLRTPVGGSSREPLWDRLRPRLDAQLVPILTGQA